ncbi:hypothetical protein Fot_06457 [Forsythia ovata]|uniref:Uncharacterized protein n=1 Tax=Forsythia ovata TaxID=205694 RepID=A0ABD1WT18_9LAMI
MEGRLFGQGGPTLQVLPNQTNDVLPTTGLTQPLWRRDSLVRDVLHFKSYQIRRRRSYLQQVLPNLHGEEMLWLGRSYTLGPTKTDEGGPSSNRSYPTSIKREFPRQRGPTPSGLTQLSRRKSYMTS